MTDHSPQIPRNTILPPHLRVNDRRQAERVAAITDPEYPATGTARISAMLAAAKNKEAEQRRASARARLYPTRAD